MKRRKVIGNLGKDVVEQKVDEFLEELDQGAVALLENFEEIENPEYVNVEKDNEGKVLSGTKKDGSHYAYNMHSETIDALNQDVEELRGEIEDIPTLENFENIEDVEGRKEIVEDKDGKIIAYRKPDGTFVENIGLETDKLSLTPKGMTAFQKALKDAGFNPGGGGDYTDKSSMEIPMPRCAIVNITAPYGNATWPDTKSTDANYYMEFYDSAGNYFKKEIIFNAQGRSSMNYEKKNGAVDICNNNGWDDDDTFKIRFGDWVPQDSFHFKAYYTDFFKGINVIAYTMFDNIWKTRGIYNDRPYKKKFIPSPEDIGYSSSSMQETINDIKLQVDNGARCIPDGFPAIFYLNGEFYGVYSWQLKKHRDNYFMTKDKGEHIHLDGNLDSPHLFGANGDTNLIDWNPDNWAGFEIRNPKDLWTMAGEKYDADLNLRQEPVDSTTAEAWISNGALPSGTVITDKIKKQLRYSAKVRQYILTLSTYIPTLQSMRSGGSTDEEIREQIEDFFDVDSLIDYILWSSVADNWDGFKPNWQYTTWDGTKWAVCPYDMDLLLGGVETGNLILDYAANNFINTDLTKPSGWITTYYKSELKARWQELVTKNIVVPDTFNSILLSWLNRIGADNFSKEYKKWTNSPCNRESNENSQYWKFTGSTQGGNSSPTPVWDNTTNYNGGDRVWFKVDRYYQFEAVNPSGTANVGHKPIENEDLYTGGSPALGFKDNIYRVMNTYLRNYNNFSQFINNLNV